MYSVRIGKQNNTVWVRTPKGRVLRLHRHDLSRDQAKRVANRIRSQLKRGGKLNSAQWQIIK